MMNSLRPWLLTLLALFCFSALPPLGLAAEAAETPRIIFDTDMTGDVDDVLALAMLHTLADAGKCELLGVTVSKSHPLTGPFVDAVNTFYGRPDLPIGIGRDAPPRASKYLKLVERAHGRHMPHDLVRNDQAPAAVALLRELLAGQPDHSVTLVQVGLGFNTANLLKSVADDASPLSGFELVRKKVRCLSVMAGAFEPINGNSHYLEANVRNHVASMRQIAKDWPADVPVVWSGFEIGIAVPYPRASIRDDFSYTNHHPVQEAYLLHSGPNHDRPTWDLTSVLYAVFPHDEQFFRLSDPGTVTVEDDGFTQHEPQVVGRDRFLIMSDQQRQQVEAALVHWVRRPPTVDADIVLQDGAIYDGAGGEPLRGDVAVKEGEIVAVGKFQTRGVPWILPCAEHVVCPGFIDLHNHSDRGILRPETRGNVNFLLQGCTTIVTGNCGSGPVDAKKYYDTIAEHGAGSNVAHLLPQGSLRGDVVGSARRKAEPQELERMLELAEQAMMDGVWGMSTGLIYVPSSYADMEELIAIAKVVAAHDGIYASHMRGEGTGLLSSVEELLRIGREAKLPVHISHFKSSGRDAWGLVREAIRVVEEAQELGQRVTADQYPYIASSTSLDATVIPSAARAGGRKKMLARLQSDETGPDLRKRIAASIAKKDDGRAIRFAVYAPRPDWAGKSLAEVAKLEGKPPVEVAIEVARNGGAQIVNFSMSEEDVRYVMQTPWVATASDGRTFGPAATRPHPRYYGTFPRKVGHYSIREKVLPLAAAIRSATGLPADILQMRDRGYVSRGMAADLTVFSPERFIDRATFDDPHQYGAGVETVLVNGKLAVYRGQPTGALHGRPLRKPSTPMTLKSTK